MNRLKFSLLFFPMIITFATFAWAGEPNYCNPAQFKGREISPRIRADGLFRLHEFSLGEVHVAGLSVGKSNIENLKAFSIDEALRAATGNDGKIAENKYCTWYANITNQEAARTFNHTYVPAPQWIVASYTQAVDAFDKSLNPLDPFLEQNTITDYLQSLDRSFSDGPGSFVYCAEKYKFLAMGCDGEKQRGPTVYGALLAFSGCSPENAAKIVNSTWDHHLIANVGSNIQEAVRLDILRAFSELGKSRPAIRERLRNLFEGNVTENKK
jgi:hypothetical protein